MRYHRTHIWGSNGLHLQLSIRKRERGPVARLSKFGEIVHVVSSEPLEFSEPRIRDDNWGLCSSLRQLCEMVRCNRPRVCKQLSRRALMLCPLHVCKQSAFPPIPPHRVLCMTRVSLPVYWASTPQQRRRAVLEFFPEDPDPRGTYSASVLVRCCNSHLCVYIRPAASPSTHSDRTSSLYLISTEFPRTNKKKKSRILFFLTTNNRRRCPMQNVPHAFVMLGSTTTPSHSHSNRL